MTEENEQRMERLFHDHYEQMYRFAFALLHDNEEARDVVSYSVIRLCYREGMSYSDYEVKEDGKHVGKVKYDDDESRTILGPVHEADAMS